MPHELGLCAAAFGDLGLDEAMQAAGNLDVDVLDLPTDSTAAFTPTLDELRSGGWADRVAKHSEDLGLPIRSVSNSRDSQLILGPHGRQTDGIHEGGAEEKQAYGLAYARATIDVAARLGAAQVRLFFGTPDFSDWLMWSGGHTSWDDHLEAFAAVAGPLIARCRRHGVQLVIEPHPKQVVYNKHSALAAWRALHDSAGPGIQICLDPANILALGYDPAGVSSGWGGALGAVHVKDLETLDDIDPAGSSGPPFPAGSGWTTYGPQPPIRFRALGLGTLPWLAMLSRLMDEGVAGAVYVEHEDHRIPRGQGITLAVRRLRDWLPTSEPEGRTW